MSRSAPCALLAALLLGAGPPAPSPAPSPASQLRTIATVRATPFCNAIAQHFNAAVVPMLANDRDFDLVDGQLVDLNDVFHHADYQTRYAGLRVALMKKVNRIRTSLPEIQEQINSLREGRTLTKDPAQAKQLTQVAEKLQLAYNKQFQLATDLGGVVQTMMSLSAAGRSGRFSGRTCRTVGAQRYAGREELFALRWAARRHRPIRERGCGRRDRPSCKPLLGAAIRNSGLKVALLFTVMLLFASPAANARNAASGAQPSAQRLGMFLGSWTSSGTIILGPGQKPAHVRGTTRCAWSAADHAFLVCDGTATIGGRPGLARQVSVYTFDPATNRYGFVNVTPSRVGSPNLALSGNTWTYSDKFNDGGRTTYFRTLNTFDSADRYRYLIQSSADGLHWSQTGSGVAVRRP